ncbi:transcription termination factor 5, mitochondrial isoform X2 [Odontomachus brunneus]|uniref:transcription termination factor 5, mitochondrial isoform X2 n=1 Tax=Odontomachus brunneus TaxID=486640 RepID=UPI0013F20C55|nr:transcription termination factor 5, mitochondrial isoform X2 [Odontomachus brunneus]
MSRIKIRMFRRATQKEDLFQKTLITNLGLNSDEAKQIVSMNKTTSYAVHRFVNNCLVCRKHKVEVRPLEHFQYCLGLLPYTLEHRINVLKDIGVQEVSVTQINKLLSYLNKSVLKFKKLTNIPLDQDIRKNISSRLCGSPTNMYELDLSNNRMKTRDYYNKCLLSCKTQIFNLPNLDDTVLLKNDIKHKSISMIAETLKVLRLDLDYDDKYITSNPKIILAPAENVRLLLNIFKDTGLVGLSIEKVLREHPYLLFEDANNMKQLTESFKRYNIPDKYAHRSMKIFTLSNEVFVKRIRMIMKHPDLHLWYKYPRILQIVFHKNMVMDRVKYLHYMNRIKWAHTQTVLMQENQLDRFVHYGTSTLMSSKPLQYLLNTKLKIQLTNVGLIKKLMKHPHWKTANFNDIKKMLDYLIENFTIDEIYQNIHIILYSRSAVEEMLTELRQKYSQSTEYSFTNSQYLALCLYMLEKDTHFTGDGIWSKGHNVGKQTLSGKQSVMNKTDNDADVDVSSARNSDKINPNLTKMKRSQ